MHNDDLEQFARSCVQAWSTEDDAARRVLIDRLYAELAVFCADEPGPTNPLSAT